MADDTQWQFLRPLADNGGIYDPELVSAPDWVIGTTLVFYPAIYSEGGYASAVVVTWRSTTKYVQHDGERHWLLAAAVDTWHDCNCPYEWTKYVSSSANSITALPPENAGGTAYLLYVKAYTVIIDIGTGTYEPDPPDGYDDWEDVPIYNVTTEASPSAGGTTAGDGDYYAGQSCTITATPNTGYKLAYWSDGSSSVTSSTYTFSVTGNVKWTAYFTQETLYTVKMQIAEGVGLATLHQVTWHNGDATVVTDTGVEYEALVTKDSFATSDEVITDPLDPAVEYNLWFPNVGGKRHTYKYVITMADETATYDASPGYFDEADVYQSELMQGRLGELTSGVESDVTILFYVRSFGTGLLLYSPTATGTPLLYGSSGALIYDD